MPTVEDGSAVEDTLRDNHNNTEINNSEEVGSELSQERNNSEEVESELSQERLSGTLRDLGSKDEELQDISLDDDDLSLEGGNDKRSDVQKLVKKSYDRIFNIIAGKDGSFFGFKKLWKDMSFGEKILYGFLTIISFPLNVIKAVLSMISIGSDAIRNASMIRDVPVVSHFFQLLSIIPQFISSIFIENPFKDFDFFRDFKDRDFTGSFKDRDDFMSMRLEIEINELFGKGDLKEGVQSSNEDIRIETKEKIRTRLAWFRASGVFVFAVTILVFTVVLPLLDNKGKKYPSSVRTCCVGAGCINSCPGGKASPTWNNDLKGAQPGKKMNNYGCQSMRACDVKGMYSKTKRTCCVTGDECNFMCPGGISSPTWNKGSKGAQPGSIINKNGCQSMRACDIKGMYSKTKRTCCVAGDECNNMCPGGKSSIVANIHAVNGSPPGSIINKNYGCQSSVACDV